MVKRGRPSLNITPEERLQRRRLQLVASQRKRRAHKRLSQLSKPSRTSSSVVTPESHSLPAMPTMVCQFYDAMFPGQSTEAAVPQQHGIAAARKMPSPDPQATLAVCHHCGSAPLDMATLTAAISSSSPASLLWTAQVGTDTYALSSRLASPMRPSTWADYTFANEPGKADTG
ncbi:hypothetical protein V8C37DRAFT_72658 [Trichoderma ceciliae]